jgi:hypothetical protein
MGCCWDKNSGPIERPVTGLNKVRDPLTNIVGLVAILNSTNLDDEQRRHLKSMNENLERAVLAINNVKWKTTGGTPV